MIESYRPSVIATDPVLLFESMSIDPNQPIELLTLTEVAKLLKISESGVRRLQQSRKLTFVKISGSVRFSKSDIISYLEKRRIASID